ncbi:MAG: 16S rRNA (cytosine(1402)-N(4))-methyltransferase RsmH [Pirellulaceae bacterium]|jgi:16S rRNA (cytosine1402-N4)-methyltransferase|nr:16S rRNA (cytosine(1402)-N(4))-methyltransferase RsmH [Pirellulaceae bacterium]
MEQPKSAHVSVMSDEIIQWLSPSPGQTFVDGTLGGGGHTRLIAESVGDQGQVISFDRDPAAIDRAVAHLQGLPVKVVHADFREIPEVLDQLSLPPVNGVVLDLGLSSDQLADEARGFSYDAPGDLDLRFDPQRGEPAWGLIRRLSEKALADVIYRYGEERRSRRIAKQIVARRRSQPIRTSRDLAELVRSCVPRSPNHRIDPATRTFQALRIAVNDELTALERTLQRIPPAIAEGGRLAVISFHSLEDRLVKNAFRHDGRYMPLTKKPIRPNESELLRNPRSRSARLRVAQRTDASVA